MADEIKQLIDMVANLRTTMLDKFADIDGRFDRIEERLDEHDGRFDRIEERLDEHDGRFDRIDKRLDEHDRQFTEINGHFKEIKADLEQLKSNQNKIINTMKIFDKQIKANRAMIEKLQNSEDYLQL